MRGRMIHDKFGALHFSPYDRDPSKYINSIGRASLNTTVIEAASPLSQCASPIQSSLHRVDLE